MRAAEAITLPDSVRELGNAAFTNCSALTEITIPSGIETIGVSAFYGCSLLETVTFASDDTGADSSWLLYAYDSESGTLSETPEDATLLSSQITAAILKGNGSTYKYVRQH